MYLYTKQEDQKINGEWATLAVSNQTENGGAADEFGANEWMVEELYERFVVDKNSVDPNWWPTLEK